ncbi:MAG TPA: methionine--tRNA ligase [bacterium]|nr:methionine--tRNA ligase [bacterium]
MTKFYLTTTLPYINSEPHIGFALEIVRADVLARSHRLSGDEVFFNTGTDEHGLKIWRKAESLGLSVQEYCDRMAESFKELKGLLDLSFDNFIRTTDAKHQAAVQEFWRRCVASGDIYKKHYSVKYCVGCEMEKTDSELENDRCPLHPGQDLELIDEENYFFRLSKYQDKLLALYSERPDFVLPENRLKEVKNFVASGLHDFSISRLASKLPWGIPVPGDEEQVMYVWFDALVNYISALGWPEQEVNFSKWWPGVQIAGKDNLRPQALMWQAMLLSAGLPNSQQIFINGFITAGGQKMSKSLSNVVSPKELVEKYGGDAVRYFLLAEINDREDGDYTEDRFIDSYQANLANGLGNLFSRLGNLAWKYGLEPVNKGDNGELSTKVEQLVKDWHFNQALNEIWSIYRQLDAKLTEQQPWKLEPDQAKACLIPLINEFVAATSALRPFLPTTAEKILNFFSQNFVGKPEPLFPRVDNIN